jgi:hypothetical protein
VVRVVDSDDVDMNQPAEHIYAKTCAKCERHALTFDEEDRALCPRHATIFIMIPRVEPNLDDDWSMATA